MEHLVRFVHCFFLFFFVFFRFYNLDTGWFFVCDPSNIKEAKKLKLNTCRVCYAETVEEESKSEIAPFVVHSRFFFLETCYTYLSGETNGQGYWGDIGGWHHFPKHS